MSGRRLLDQYRNYILDCDGVLWHSAAAIAGSVAAVARMRAAGKRVVFVTNNASTSRADYALKFARLGFKDVSEADILSSGSAAADYCAAHKLAKAFVIGEPGLVTELEAQGVKCVREDSDEPLHDEAFAAIKLDDAVAAVVVGWDRAFSYRKLCFASLYLQAGAQLVATNPDASDKVGGRFMPGNGCSVAAIQVSVNDPAGAKTVVTGKPSKALMQAVLAKYDFDPKETIMVGDRLDTDIAFASGLIDSLLVLSGCTSVEEAASGTPKPTFVAESLAEALDMDMPSKELPN